MKRTVEQVKTHKDLQGPEEEEEEEEEHSVQLNMLLCSSLCSSRAVKM